MSQKGFKHPISGSERPHTNAVDRTAIDIGRGKLRLKVDV
jgi:hypothetical protein